MIINDPSVTQKISFGPWLSTTYDLAFLYPAQLPDAWSDNGFKSLCFRAY